MGDRDASLGNPHTKWHQAGRLKVESSGDSLRRARSDWLEGLDYAASVHHDMHAY